MSRLSELLKGLKGENWRATLLQFIKFGLVGVSNTAISYGIEMLFFYVILVRSSMAQNGKVILTSAVAFIVSVTNSYFWNNRFVFKSSGRKKWRDHAAAYARTVLCYGITGLVISPAIKMFLVGRAVPYYLASLASLIISIPLNFVLNKFWAFK